MESPNPGSQTILLAILADKKVRQEMEALLTGTTFKVETASSAEEGLIKADELIPGAILLDIDPALKSFDTCRRLRASKLLVQTPIVMLFSPENRDERAAGLSAGADDFIEKPLDGLELISRIGTLTRLNSQRILLTHLTRFTWIVDHASEGYLILDRAGSILYANERASEMLNLAEDFTGLPFTNAVQRIYLPEPASAWENWLQDPESCFLVQPESPTARAYWLILEALEMNMGADYQRIVRLRDVTERMSIYQDMRRFHTVVAHKLRTPVSIMVSNIGLLKNKIEFLSPDEILEFTRNAYSGADRLAGEIRKILTYIDAPLSLNLGEAVRLEALPELLQETSKLLDIQQVHLTLPENLRGITIALTRDALEMIFHELLDNARKFHPEHTPVIEITVGRTLPGFVNLRLTDDGTHLTPEQLQWAWLPYMQGEKDFTGELPGLGLGFPMVAVLVWKAGGSLRLRNRPDGPGVIIDMKIPLESTSRQMERRATPYQME